MKKSSYLAVPIAAFLLAGTSVSAFNPDLLEKAGLSETQIAAFEEAKELRKSGDKDAARDVLAEADINLSTLEEVRKAAHVERKEHREAVKQIIESGDYDAFVELQGDGPLFYAIDSETDFLKLREAHELRASGDHEGAKAIFTELGIKPGHGHGMRGSHRGHFELKEDREVRE